MKKLKKKITIENATKFKLEYYEGGSDLKSKTFNSFKAMEQFHSRQTDFMYLDCNRYAMVEGVWYRFVKLNSPIVFQTDVDRINNIFNDIVEESNLQSYKIKD